MQSLSLNCCKSGLNLRFQQQKFFKPSLLVYIIFTEVLLHFVNQILKDFLCCTKYDLVNLQINHIIKEL